MNTLDIVIILVGLFAGVFVFAVGILRAPVMQLSLEEKEKIKQNGLIHFTKTEHIESIQINGLRGTISKMGFEPLLGNLVWLYLYEGHDISIWRSQRRTANQNSRQPWASIT